jgi:hypothetical protein
MSTKHLIAGIIFSAIAALLIFGGGLYLGWAAHKSISEITIGNEPQNFLTNEDIVKPEKGAR